MSQSSTLQTKCETCDSEFTPKRNTTGKYCSRSCSATASNSRVPRRIRTGPKDCAVCAKPVQAGRTHCSADCRGKAKILPWLKGEESGSYANGTLKKVIRYWLIEQAGNKCTECGWGKQNPILGHAILTVDHVDGNWQNNSVDNLKVLCYNCHTLTPTFGSLNWNNENKQGGRRIGT